MAWPGGGMMSMKRFTDLNRKQDNMKLMDAPMSRGNAACWLRLCAIEDILGDDYDLDRLRELTQADKEGRCAVLPVKLGDSVRFAKNPRAKYETVDAITIYPDGRMSFGFHEYGVKTVWVDRWIEDDACIYVQVESTEAAQLR